MAETNLLVLAKEFAKLRENVKEVLKMPIGPQGLNGKDGKDGINGLSGKDGKIGINGKDGKDGEDGLNGAKGLNGKDGKDGKDGVSIVEAYISADNSLVLVLSSGKEIDVGSLDLFINGSQSLSVLKQTQDSTVLAALFVQKTFETTNKNLASSNATLVYNANNDLTSITYGNGILKTLAYNANSDLITVTLSGATPQNINLIKTFSYDANGNLTSFAYT